MNISPKIPGWMKALPNHSFIGTEEIAQIYGINRSSVGRCIARGSVPTPVMTVRRAHGRDALKWKMGDIRKNLVSGTNSSTSQEGRATPYPTSGRVPLWRGGSDGLGKRK